MLVLGSKTAHFSNYAGKWIGTLLFMTMILLHAFIQGGMSRLGALFLSISLDLFESFHFCSSCCVGFDVVAALSLLQPAHIYCLPLKVSGVVEHDIIMPLVGALRIP